MSRQVVAGVAIGGAFSLTALLKVAVRYAGEELSHVVALYSGELIGGGLRVLLENSTDSVFRLGGIWILFELRAEILYLLRLLLSIVLWCVERCVAEFPPWPRKSITEAERLETTCQQMALVAAPGVNPGTPLGFLLLERSCEWDEVYVASRLTGTGDLIVKTTTADASDWQWSIVRAVLGAVRAPVGVGGARGPPAGLQAGQVNWICPPENPAAKWNPHADELAAIQQEGQLLAIQLSQSGVNDSMVTIPGQGMDLIPVPVGGPPAVGPGGAGVLAPAQPAAVAALGPVGPTPSRKSGVDPLNLQSLADAVQELRSMAKDKDSKDRRKKKKKDKKKKKKRKSRDTSSSSSRSRSSRSSSSSEDDSDAPLRWGYKAKTKDVEHSQIYALDQQKFKRKGELVAYATKHPGALTAHFLASIYARLSKGRLTRSSQLRQASVVSWASQFSGLTEIRDIREVLTLAEAMDAINRKEIARAMDVLTQRILAIQQAKKKGGTWEKAEMIELIPSGSAVASSSMLALTN